MPGGGVVEEEVAGVHRLARLGAFGPADVRQRLPECLWGLRVLAQVPGGLQEIFRQGEGPRVHGGRSRWLGGGGDIGGEAGILEAVAQKIDQPLPQRPYASQRLVVMFRCGEDAQRLRARLPQLGTRHAIVVQRLDGIAQAIAGREVQRSEIETGLACRMQRRISGVFEGHVAVIARARQPVAQSDLGDAVVVADVVAEGHRLLGIHLELVSRAVEDDFGRRVHLDGNRDRGAIDDGCVGGTEAEEVVARLGDEEAAAQAAASAHGEGCRLAVHDDECLSNHAVGACGDADLRAGGCFDLAIGAGHRSRGQVGVRRVQVGQLDVSGDRLTRGARSQRCRSEVPELRQSLVHRLKGRGGGEKARGAACRGGGEDPGRSGWKRGAQVERFEASSGKACLGEDQLTGGRLGSREVGVTQLHHRSE